MIPPEISPEALSANLDGLPADRQEKLAELLDQCLAQLEQGQACNLDDLEQQYPDLVGPLRSYLRSLSFLHLAVREPSSASPAISAVEALDEQRLGDYRLIREVGRGGMGVVYEAQQISLGRRVALKVLPFAAVLDERQIARFQNEALAAASLHHPNIVPVYGVGCERGVHHYSMQLIEGQSLDRMLGDTRAAVGTEDRPTGKSRSGGLTGRGDRSSRPTGAMRDTVPIRGPIRGPMRAGNVPSTEKSVRSRGYVESVIQLGIQAAEALAYAHECGVVHRDIKPSNLMVDRHGKLWVTDFGLARFGAGLEITRAGELLGTVRYMSPEQASGASHLVDHRTDIYSLAATLYELLTLRPVFEGTDRQQVIRQIESSEPRAPRSLNRAISVDLETILIKALAKSRDDRYRSAGDLAADLRRVLEGRPAQARRLTVLDRAARYAVRHSRRVLIGTAALTIALAGISVTAVLFARQNSRLAEAQQRATLHLETAQRVVNRFDTQLAEQLDGLPGAETVRSELLRDALEYHRSFLAYAAQDPALKQDLANTHHKIAKVLERLGQSDAALRAYADARDRYLELSRRLPAEFQHAADAAMCDNNRGVVLMRIGQDVEAAEAYAAATARLERLQHAWPNEARIARDLAVANLNRGRLHYGRSEFIAARQALDAARSTLQSLLTCPADLRATKLHLAATLHAIASLPGEPFEAQKANLLAALELYTRLIAEQHQDVDTLQVAALCYSHLGAMERDQWLTQSNATQVDHDKVSSIPATQAFEQAISLQLKLVRQAPLVLQYRSELAASWNNLGQWQADQGQLATAESSLGKARELLESICTDHPDQLAERSSLGGVLHNLALVLERQQRFAEAVALLEVAISHQQFAADQAPNVTRYREFLAEHLAQFQRLERHASKEGAMSDNHAHDATVQVSVAPERYKGPTP